MSPRHRRSRGSSGDAAVAPTAVMPASAMSPCSSSSWAAIRSRSTGHGSRTLTRARKASHSLSVDTWLIWLGPGTSSISCFVMKPPLSKRSFRRRLTRQRSRSCLRWTSMEPPVYRMPLLYAPPQADDAGIAGEGGEKPTCSRPFSWYRGSRICNGWLQMCNAEAPGRLSVPSGRFARWIGYEAFRLTPCRPSSTCRSSWDRCRWPRSCPAATGSPASRSPSARRCS